MNIYPYSLCKSPTLRVILEVYLIVDTFYLDTAGMKYLGIQVLLIFDQLQYSPKERKQCSSKDFGRLPCNFAN